ncbi:MAG: sulfite exporter TauE/SafE family protein, partial [Pseudolabrys sp.]|nr:sulfite exporter TauE/SafE family protein [Pseudolabrys sp.]
GFAASMVFIWQGAVMWPQTLALMAGMLVGGIAGSYIARILSREVVRVLVVGFGATLTIVFAWQYWF